MPKGPNIHTDRLLLRRWQESDMEPFAALNADPVVMEHFPALLDPAQSASFVSRIESCFEEKGYGLWAVEHARTGQFLGYTGLNPARFEAHFTPAVEVGWRLAREHWGNGYATEAAQAATGYGFDEVGLDRIVSFTVPANTRSVRVMEKLGMTHDPDDDFDHPRFEEGSPFRRHVLYRMTEIRWRSLV